MSSSSKWASLRNQILTIGIFHGVHRLLSNGVATAQQRRDHDSASRTPNSSVEFRETSTEISSRSIPISKSSSSSLSSIDVKSLRDFVKRFLVAVTAASVALRFDYDGLRKSSLVTCYLAVRVVRRWMSGCSPWWASTAVMCTSAAQILSTWIDSPHQLHPGYRKFLDQHGGKSWAQYRGLRDWSQNCRQFPMRHSESQQLFPGRSDGRVASACYLIHPNTNSCATHACRQFWPQALRRALRVYVFLHAVLALLRLWRARRHLTHASSADERRSYLVETLKRYLGDVTRSSVFLASYCTLGWWTACYAYRYTRWDHVSRRRLFIHLFVPGLPVLLEPSRRRSELAGYCASQALNSIWLTFGWKLPTAPLIVLLTGLLYS